MAELQSNLPIFMQDPKTNEILGEAASVIPKGLNVYLSGGALRNALYYELFHKRLPQRDYDLLVLGKKEGFIKRLRPLGFVYGRIRRKHETVLMKKKVSKPKTFSDYVVLDIKETQDRNIKENMRMRVSFTVNGFALPLKHISSRNWRKQVIAMPGAMDDLKGKKLHMLNIAHPANLFAAIRFMSKGFKAPPKDEVDRLLSALGGLEKWRFNRNVRKVFDYVGGEAEARRLARRLGIEKDIFDFETIKTLNVGKR